MATMLFWPNRQSWCGCCNEALIELLNWPGPFFPVSAPKRGMQRGADVGEVDLRAGPAEPPVEMDGTAFLRNPDPATGFRRCGAEPGGTPSLRGFCFFRTNFACHGGQGFL